MEQTNAVIKKEGNKYVIYSKTGKKLGEYTSKKAAEKRLRQIEYFKHQKGMFYEVLDAFLKGDEPEDRV